MLGKRLRQLQEFLGWSHDEMAKAGGRSRITYAEYIRGKKPRIPGADFIANLIRNTDCSARWLLLGEGEMFISEDPTDNQEKELLASFKELPTEKQEMYHHKIKGDAIEERLKRKANNG